MTLMHAVLSHPPGSHGFRERVPGRPWMLSAPFTGSHDRRRQRPVLESGTGRLVGILSYVDVLRACKEGSQ